MPEEETSFLINCPIEQTWDILNDFEALASAMPGFISYRAIDELNSEWKLKIDVGILSRLVNFKACITEKQAPEFISFDLKGLDENVMGKGALSLQKQSTNETSVTFKISLEAGGQTAPLVNSLVSSALRSQIGEFEERLRKLLVP
ncbi:MAG: CoxG family protein [Nitrososphaerales archaeon]